MTGTPYYVPSYLDNSSPDNWKRLANTMPHVGPLRFAPAFGSYTVSKADLDWVIKFTSTGDVNVPVDADLENQRIPIGAQIAVLNASYGRVRINPAPGVTIVSGESTRFVVNKWKVGILVKTGANFWLLSLGQGSGGGTNTVPLAPVLKDCFGLSGGVYVGWAKPTDDGGSAITQYIVERSENGTDWVASGFTQPDTPYLTVGELTVGKTYAFRVKAINAIGASEPSNVLSASPSVDFNQASGGTVSTFQESGRTYRAHTFSATGQLSIAKAVNPFRVAAIGAGGGGADGLFYMGGGNPGVLTENPNVMLQASTYTVTVGVGGSGGTNADGAGGANLGGAGGSSTLDSVTALGGAPRNGGGGTRFAPGLPGPTTNYNGTSVQAGTGGTGGGDCNAGGCPAGNGGPGVVIVAYEVSPYNSADGGEIIDYSDQQGNRWRAHRFTNSGTFTVLNATNQFRAMVLGGGAGGGYGTGGGHGEFNDTMIDLSVQNYTITVGAAVDGGYHEVTNRDAPGNNGQRSAIEGVLSSPGGISRGGVVGPGPTTNITGTVVQYGGSGGRCVINEDRNEGGYPGGGTGGSTATGATLPGGGGGGGQWNSGSGARGEVVIAYRIKNPD